MADISTAPDDRTPTGRTSHRATPTRSAWPVLVPAVAAAVLTLPFLGRAAAFRDEAATVSAARRSVPELFRLLQNVDRVHGLYYLAMHFWIEVSSQLWWLRLPSALAAIAAVIVTARLAERLFGRAAAVVAGLVTATSSIVVDQALTARSYTIVCVVVVGFATLVLGVDDRDPRRSRTATSCVVALMAVFLHLFAGGLAVTTIAVAHAAVSRHRSRSTFRHSLVVAGFTIVTLVGAAAVLRNQSERAFLGRPGLGTVWQSAVELFGNPLAVVLAVVATLVAMIAGRQLPAVRVLLAWTVVPPLVLFVASFVVQPAFRTTYFVSTVIPTSLLMGFVASRAWSMPSRRVALVLGTAGALVIAQAVTSVPLAVDRVHVDDARDVSSTIATLVRTGDAAVFAGGSRDLFEYEMNHAVWARLRDVLLDRSPIASGTLAGTDVDATSSGPLRVADRVWFFEALHGTSADDDALRAAAADGRRIVTTVKRGATRATLYVRP